MKEINSSRYFIRKLNEGDYDDILKLMKGNPLYFEYYPPFPDKQDIIDDMHALPDEKTPEDKYYIGYFLNDRLIAVMDLIVGYPNKHTVFIGFFMTSSTIQNQGIGSSIITNLINNLKSPLDTLRLAYIKGNPQAEAFWLKNGFIKTGEEKTMSNDTVAVLMERKLTNSV